MFYPTSLQRIIGPMVSKRELSLRENLEEKETILIPCLTHLPSEFGLSTCSSPSTKK